MEISEYSTELKESVKDQERPRMITWKLIWEEINNRSAGLFALAVSLSVLIAWRLKRHELITPEHGIGYVFGILGTLLTIILFVYSFRKRIGKLEVIGTIKAWFRIHMALGILGPILILFHANFHLGALNSNVALFSILIVAGSGVIGRYIYSRIHYELYGEMANLIELKNKFDQQKEEANLKLAVIPGVKEELFSFVDYVLNPSMALIDSIRRFWIIRWRSQRTLWKILRMSDSYIKQNEMGHKWGLFIRLEIQHKARALLDQAIKVAEFNLYERLFSLWHMFHIPLVFVLVFAVIMHVVSVNCY